ncbi:hypothetical protein AM593_04782, partial [Mytilus galloprovincialis]
LLLHELQGKLWVAVVLETPHHVLHQAVVKISMQVAILSVINLHPIGKRELVAFLSSRQREKERRIPKRTVRLGAVVVVGVAVAKVVKDSLQQQIMTERNRERTSKYYMYFYHSMNVFKIEKDNIVNYWEKFVDVVNIQMKKILYT